MADGSVEEIRDSMRHFIKRLEDSKIICYGARTDHKKYYFNGRLNDQETFETLLGFTIGIVCSFYVDKNGIEYIYFDPAMF